MRGRELMTGKFTGEMNHWRRGRVKEKEGREWAGGGPLPRTTEWTRNVSGFRSECLECSRNKKLIVTQVSAAVCFQGNEGGKVEWAASKAST